jgi:hypothetical protein
MRSRHIYRRTILRRKAGAYLRSRVSEHSIRTPTASPLLNLAEAAVARGPLHGWRATAVDEVIPSGAATRILGDPRQRLREAIRIIRCLKGTIRSQREEIDVLLEALEYGRQLVGS